MLCRQVYHISRNLWSRLETRTVKNVCAPAAIIEDKIYIIGGEWEFYDNQISNCHQAALFDLTDGDNIKSKDVSVILPYFQGTPSE